MSRTRALVKPGLSSDLINLEAWHQGGDSRWSHGDVTPRGTPARSVDVWRDGDLAAEVDACFDFLRVSCVVQCILLKTAFPIFGAHAGAGAGCLWCSVVFFEIELSQTRQQN